MIDATRKKVAILATDYFEEVELTGPFKAITDAGIAAEVVAPHGGTIKALRHVDPGEAVTVDKTLAEANPDDYAAVVLPGGVVNADHLRIDPAAQGFVRALMSNNKPVAVICHGPWLLVSAGLVQGRRLTSYPTLQDDIKNAGGNWVDEQVVVDNNLITSRRPDDLPAFNAALLNALRD